MADELQALSLHNNAVPFSQAERHRALRDIHQRRAELNAHFLAIKREIRELDAIANGHWAALEEAHE